MARFGAIPVRGGVRFRVWAPDARELTLVVHDGPAAGAHAMPADDDGVRDLIVDGAAPGHRYAYRIDGGDLRPDPASRFQPEGVHGPSEILDPAGFTWSDRGWRGRNLQDLVVYELHIGTFSPEGTFDGARRRLRHVRDLGATAVEVMPVADFSGDRNWGYDGVCLFAPARAYGRPDDFRRFVDEAHQLGLSVMLDVVYNHLGPEGAYLPQFNPGYFTERHKTPWGAAINLDGPGSAMVRRFIVENAAHWVAEYHLDGLRLDATHALIDDSPVHIVAELAETIRAGAPHAIVVHAEDHRNLASIVQPRAAGGWGLDGVWADDFHHVMRRLLAGDSHAYYADFEGTTPELAQTMSQGWLFTGQYSANMREPRGTEAGGVPMRASVVCLQNHDQIGNRATGDRITASIASDAWRAASVVLLTSPMTPLLFMGQEWAATTPFQYFTDLSPELGRLVTEGRRQEFAGFPEFSDPASRERIPDPQARATFEASRLNWAELDRPEHARVLALYRALLALRREHRELAASEATRCRVIAPDDGTVVVRRDDEGAVSWVVARLKGSGAVNLAAAADLPLPGDEESWAVLLTTEDGVYAGESAPIHIDWPSEGPIIRFSRPGAVILKQR